MLLPCLLLVGFAAAAAAAPATSEPFRSLRSPRDIIANYEVVLPVITGRDTDELYPKELEVLISSRTEEFILDLELNEILLSPHFSSRHYDNHGREIVTKGHTNCYYQGKVKGHPEWTAVISTCHGLQGSFGKMDDSTQFYHLEPLNANDTTIDQPHALYLASEYKPQTGSCGSKHHPDDTVHLPYMDANMTDSIREKVRRRRQSNGFLFVEWVLVNDNRQFLAYDSNLERVVLRSIELANHVDNLFRPLNIRVILVDVITWNNGDQISVVRDPETLLDNFELYVPNIPSSYDSTMLITGVDIQGNTVGIAYIGTMCNSRVSIGLTQDGARGSIDSVGVTAAHELGHIFNMGHDSGGCTCNDPSGRCIMAAVSSFPPSTLFSSCSRDDLDFGFNNLNLGRCLTNEPSTTVGDPVCGNGIVEENEICDCGSPQECNDPCCNAQTCQLAAGAQCSSGPCCTSSCTFRAYGTTCRAASGECDITEYCPGDSSECPEDRGQQDGTACDNNSGYCYEGLCPTHGDQCRYHFGQNSGKGLTQCYTSYNTRGDQFGNCGHTSTSYRSCAASDVQCGQLHCIPGPFQRNVDHSVTIATVSVFVGGRFQECQSFTTRPGAGDDDFISPGLVQEGTKCGNDKICLQHRCVSTSQLGAQSCPVGSNGQTCSGNGACNNVGVCACNVGFTGSKCETPYNGPGSSPTNECLTNNGGCDHICSDTANGFTCSCNTGYVLAGNGKTCNDINECLTNNGGCAQRCVNTAGSRVCRCNSGYVIASNGRGCNDVNECNTNNGGCDHICTNTQGSFTCSCRAGYQLASNGRTCSDINECSTNNGGCEHVCTNTQGSFRCSCNNGFTLSGDGKSCEQNAGLCGGTLTADSGSFQSPNWPQTYPVNIECEWIVRLSDSSKTIQFTFDSSAYGLTGAPGATCDTERDYVEFLDGVENDADSLGQYCSRVVPDPVTTTSNEARVKFHAGPSHPVRRQGFKVTYEALQSVTDVDECATNNGGCDHTCTNTQGSFTCSCRAGYQLASNGRSCNDINECSTNNGGCEHVCTNTQGSFTCSCSAGYQLASNGKSCNDINECSTNNGGCEHVCTNTEGSFSCSCNSGFTLSADGKSCEEPAAQCGGTLTADSGSFQSPNWPQTYPVNIECEWIIRLSDSSKTIQFTFDSAYGLAGAIGQPCDPERDYVEFFDGVGNGVDSLGQYCSRAVPDPVTTTSNEARVKFRAGPSHPARRQGFRITYLAL